MLFNNECFLSVFTILYSRKMIGYSTLRVVPDKKLNLVGNYLKYKM